MITQLTIENYKSIQELTLDTGRVNVLIGENGCGKSNILEAITFAAAAEANMLNIDKKYLTDRGIRVTEPELMRSAFTDKTQIKPIKVTINNDKSNSFCYFIDNDNKPYSKWDVYFDEQSYQNKTRPTPPRDLFKRKLLDVEMGFESFVIYFPENSFLRDFQKESDIEPLGIHGEGLLKLLIVIQNDSYYDEAHDYGYSVNNISDINESLELFGWYEAIEIPNNLSPLEQKIIIKDRYLEMPFDQRSANEGFLLVLFYITLVVSKYTPKIFAIDNIDTSLNPKLCTKLIKELARLAKKYDKQLFVTSHNPAILDGIDLGDEEQRLFVVSRNRNGHTYCKRIDLSNKPQSASNEPLKLSEAFLSGFLGGLPKGF